MASPMERQPAKKSLPHLTFEPVQQKPIPMAISTDPSTSRVYTIDTKFFLRGDERQNVNVYYKVIHLLGRLFATGKIELLKYQTEDHPIRDSPDIPP